MLNLQRTTKIFQGTTMPVLMGIPGGAGNVSVKCIGRIPAKSFAVAAPVITRETKAGRLNRETAARRFTVEAMILQIENNLGFKVAVVSDKRGLMPGGIVRLKVQGSTDVVISTLPVTSLAGDVSETAYYVWEVSVDNASGFSPRAGRGNLDIERSVRKIRQAVNKY